MLSTNRYALQGLWHMGTSGHHGYETELAVGRYVGVNQWLFPYIGYDFHHKEMDGKKSQDGNYKNLFSQVSNKSAISFGASHSASASWRRMQPAHSQLRSRRLIRPRGTGRYGR